MYLYDRSIDWRQIKTDKKKPEFTILPDPDTNIISFQSVKPSGKRSVY